jgi:hypothetical protein
VKNRVDRQEAGGHDAMAAILASRGEQPGLLRPGPAVLGLSKYAGHEHRRGHHGFDWIGAKYPFLLQSSEALEPHIATAMIHAFIKDGLDGARAATVASRGVALTHEMRERALE